MKAELKDMAHAYQESDKRRKNAESALSEAQSRISDDTSRIQELSSQNDRIKVRGHFCIVCITVLIGERARRYQV